MVRFEKLMYERLVNTEMLKRKRVIDTPKKWFWQQRNDEMRAQAHKVFNQGITGALFKAVEPIAAWIFYKWPRDIALQRG